MKHEQLLAQIVAQYQLGNPQITFLGEMWNTTYRIEAESGERYSLRLCNPEFQDRICLQDELTFLDFVAKRQQVRITQPVRNRNDELVTVLSTPDGDRLSCLFQWVEGQEAHGRLTLPVLRQMGQATVFLHEAARSFAFPVAGDGFRSDYAYDEKLLISHRQWIAEHTAEIDGAQVALLHKAIDHVLAALDTVGKHRENYGFIHADLHPGNFIVHEGQVSVIDFDQMGRGHFGYDMALLL